jgi:diketogulonate reductase-like aldo/keto reductase
MVNQIEMHPGLANKRLLRFCKKHNIAVEAYSPLARGMIQNDKILLSIANSHNKTPAQISVR